MWAGEAATDADLVIVSIPQKNVPDLSAGIVSTAKGGAPIIETNNYYPQQRDGYIAEIEDGAPESVWVSKQSESPSSRYSTESSGSICFTAACHPGPPAVSPCQSQETTPRPNRSSSRWSTNSASTPSTAALAESWRQQPGTPVYGADLDAIGVQRALSEASPERRPEFLPTLNPAKPQIFGVVSTSPVAS